MRLKAQQEEQTCESLATIYLQTRLALESILGLFGVRLLKFTLDTYPGSLMHYI